MKKIKPSAAIRRELLSYLFWGILTTVVSWGSYTLFAWLLGKGVAVGQTKLVFWANFCSWLCAVLFSFVTNKIWVFQSRSWALRGTGAEFLKFFFSRLATGLLEIAAVPLLVHAGLDWSIFGVAGFAAKVIVSLTIVVLNYFASKFLVFYRKKS